MTWTRRNWIGIAAILLAALLVMANTPADAAPMSAPDNQTVPQPTPTSEPDALPTATPSSDNSDDDDDDDDSSEPAPDPEPAPDDGAAGGVAEALDELTDVAIGEIIGEVVVTKLNVREGPSADAAIIGTLAAGDQVALLGRNDVGDWWVACCVGETGQPGWVSAQFIRPNVRRVDVNNALAVTASLDELLAAGAIVDEVELPEEVGELAALRLVVEQTPAYVRQGGEVVLHFTVINDGEVEAQNVTLTDELPVAFSFESASVDADGSSRQTSGDNDAVIIQIDWPAIEPGGAATADVTLMLVSDAANGLVFDNLAVASAENAGDVSGGISIGTAPSLLPDF